MTFCPTLRPTLTRATVLNKTRPYTLRGSGAWRRQRMPASCSVEAKRASSMRPEASSDISATSSSFFIGMGSRTPASTPATSATLATMVHVRFGSRPPSWSQNQVKVLVDAESSLYSSSIETPGPARPWRENVLRPRSSAGLPRLYPFWIIPSNLFPLPCLQALISLSV